MCWAFSKVAACYLLALVFALSASAETGTVSAIGYGKETPDAINALLRSVMGKYFHDEPPALAKSVLQEEILPNASSFVQSYKILEGGKSSVGLSANVDLDIIRALFTLTPSELGEKSGAKALVVAKGARLPDGTQSAKGEAVDPYTALESAARERLARRKFELVRLSPEERNDLGAEDDVASLELLRGLGARAGARLALGISSHYATFESEHSHNGEQKLVVSATLVDVKTGAQLGHSSTNVSEPHGRRDQYAVELKKELAEEGKDLFHEIFVSAGKRLARATGLENFSVVRVNQPGSAQLMSQFRSFLESIKGVGSVTEQGASRGYFDFALRPVQKAPALAKAIKAASPDDIVVDVVNTEAVENSGGPLLAVTVAPKEVAPPAGEVQSEHP